MVLVHRRQLLDQWRERLATFFGISNSAIGQIGAGKRKTTGIIDIGILQSINRKGMVDDAVADYGQIIVDECHHISAFSFEQVMRQVKSRFVLGLTATPIRKDGHHPIIIMQCGPIRFKVHALQQALKRSFQHFVIPRSTSFRLDVVQNDKVEIHEIYTKLIASPGRNEMICSDVLKEVQEGRFPLILTERTEHLEDLRSRLHGKVNHLIILKGGMGAKQRASVVKQLESLVHEDSKVVLATGRYVGEGFDHAPLDTLFIAMPISWYGTLQQYAGRLHRAYEGKSEVRIYDYVDGCVPMLSKMFRKRLRGYEMMGYSLKDGNSMLEMKTEIDK